MSFKLRLMYDLQLPTVALRPGLGLVQTVHVRRLRRKQQQLRDTARVRGRVCERHRDLRGAGPEVGVRRGAGGGAVPRPGAAILPRPRHAHVSAVPVRRLRRQPQQLPQRGGVRVHVRRPRQGHVWAAGGPRALLQLPDQVTTTSPRLTFLLLLRQGGSTTLPGVGVPSSPGAAASETPTISPLSRSASSGVAGRLQRLQRLERWRRRKAV